MEDSIINSEELENGTTTNVDEVAEQEAPVTESVESSEPKTLRDAVLKAFEKTATDKEAALPKAPDPVKAEPAKEIDPLTGRELEPINAPSSMTPTLREKWGSVPREMQKYWIDRERDMSTRLQETAEERKFAKQFSEVAAPYEAMFRQHGTNAIAHTKELLNLDYALRTGSPSEKAQIIHSLVTYFKPDFQTLAQLAAGQPVQQSQAQQAPNVQELVRQELEAREAQRKDAEIEREVIAFNSDPKYEFLDQVRPLMQKALNSGMIPGNDITELLSNAYDFAVKNDPEVAKVLASRTAAAAPVQPAAQTAKPVQSVKPSLASGGRGGQSQPRFKTTREAAAAAWDKHSGN